MSFLNSLIEGINNGFRKGPGSERMHNNVICYQERGRIDRLCGEIGWDIDGREDDTIYLDFKSPIAGTRRMLISRGDEALVNFSVLSFAEVSPRRIPKEVLGYLLERNTEIALGAWDMFVNEDENVLFLCRYTAIGVGLNAGLVKYICETLNQEVHEFDERLQKAGLL